MNPANSNESAELLPGEGDGFQIVSIKKRVRKECDECGEPAKYRHTFLYDNCRNNPASKGYRRDDCTWCWDSESYVCEEHKNYKRTPDGQHWCSTFTACERFASMFLEWQEKEISKTPIADERG